MFNNNRFYRKDSRVVINIHSNLNVVKSVYPVSFDCDNENYAELLKDKFNDELSKAKREIAKEAWIYLSPNQVTQLKKKLSTWNSKTDCWK